MEIIDRYLQAVRLWLPKAQKHDIISELSEGIQSQIEERSAELGRPLKETEVQDLLVERGNPILVANRYLPQRHLIGPLLFPTYSLVLKMAWLFYLVAWLIVGICIYSFVPSYRATSSSSFIAAGLHTIWLTVVFTFAAVTMFFALVERYELKSHFLERWNPRLLPSVHDFNRIKRSSSIAELVALIVVVLFWVAFMSSPVVGSSTGAHITFAPEWRYFSWGVLLLLGNNLVFSTVNLFHPYWTRLRAIARLVSDVLGWALWAWLCTANVLTEIHLPNVSTQTTAHVAAAINLWAGR